MSEAEVFGVSEGPRRAPALGEVGRGLSKDEETIETLKRIHQELELDLEVSNLASARFGLYVYCPNKSVQFKLCNQPCFQFCLHAH